MSPSTHKQKCQEAYELLIASVATEIWRVSALLWRGRVKANAIQMALNDLITQCGSKGPQERFDYFQQQLILPDSALYQSLNQQRWSWSRFKSSAALNHVISTLHQANRKVHSLRGRWACEISTARRSVSPILDRSTLSTSPITTVTQMPPADTLTWSTIRDFLQKYDEKKRWWNWDSSYIQQLKKQSHYFVDKGDRFSLIPRHQWVDCVRALQEYSPTSLAYQFSKELLEQALPDNDFLYLDAQDQLQLKEEYLNVCENDIAMRMREQYLARFPGSFIEGSAVIGQAMKVGAVDGMRGQAPGRQWVRSKVKPYAFPYDPVDTLYPMMHASAMCSMQSTSSTQSGSMYPADSSAEAPVWSLSFDESARDDAMPSIPCSQLPRAISTLVANCYSAPFDACRPTDVAIPRGVVARRLS